MISNVLSKTDSDPDTNSSTDPNILPVSLESQLVLYILLFLDIPSVLCSLLLFYYFIRLPELRQERYFNPMVIYLLLSAFFISTVDIPLVLRYHQNHYFIVSMENPDSFCVFWIIYDYIMWSLNLWALTLFSLERYLMIFYNRMIMRNRRRRVLLYYVPIILSVVFVIFWNLYLVVLYPCAQTQFDYREMLCAFSCYEINASDALLNFDWIISGLLPVFLTVFFTLVLILHVVYQKHKISRHLATRDIWKRTRKMFLQLLPITMVFFIFAMPLNIVGLLAVTDPWYNTTPYFYVNSLSYCLPLSIPFAILSKQKLIWRKLLILFRWRRVNRIVPIIITRPL